jgi:DNA mismatch endonuclease (patch repair protein)
LTDIVSSKKRSSMMAGIRGRDTKPELRVRKELFAEGYRYRLHRRGLPGTPDIVLPGRKIAVFVNGCFWHGHQPCKLAKIPATRTDFWVEKLEQNRCRDSRVISSLLGLSWRVLVVWECFVRENSEVGAIGSAVRKWIEGEERFGELSSSKRASA